MGSYEHEKELVGRGEAKRGFAARAYFADLDEKADELTLKHRPDYDKTLFDPRNDDIYREFCSYIDQAEPRYFDTIADPIRVEGYSAADVYKSMLANNWKLHDLDGGAVYNMLVMLREKPEIAKRVLNFRPRCDKAGAC